VELLVDNRSDSLRCSKCLHVHYNLDKMFNLIIRQIEVTHCAARLAFTSAAQFQRKRSAPKVAIVFEVLPCGLYILSYITSVDRCVLDIKTQHNLDERFEFYNRYRE